MGDGAVGLGGGGVRGRTEEERALMQEVTQVQSSREPIWACGKVLLWAGSGKQKDLDLIPSLRLSLQTFCFLDLAANRTLKWLTPLPRLMQNHSGGKSVEQS